MAAIVVYGGGGSVCRLVNDIMGVWREQGFYCEVDGLLLGMIAVHNMRKVVSWQIKLVCGKGNMVAGHE
jgi:hypothetical protein